MASIIPVVGKALALQRRLERLADSQLFIALSAAQTDASSLQRSIPELEKQVAALQSALASLRDAIVALRNLPLYQEIRDVRASFAALAKALR